MNSWLYQVVGFGLASFLSDFNHEMTVSLIPTIVAQFVHEGQVPFFLGIIASITDAFAAFLRLGSGFVSDRLARKKPLIAFGYACSAIFSTLTGYAQSLLQVTLCRILSFTGSSLREPPRDALIAATVAPIYYGRAFGLKNAMDTLGSFVGPLVAFVCASFIPVREIFLLSAIPGLCAVAAIIWLTREVPRPVQQRERRGMRSIMQDIQALPTSFVLFVAILFIFEIGCFNKLLLLARAQEMLRVSGHSNAAQLVVLLYALFNLTRAGSEFLLGVLGDYCSKVRLLAVFGCGLFAGSACMMIQSDVSLAYCAVLFILAAISTAARSTLKTACAAHMLPADIRAFGYGALQASEGIATLISSALIGFLWTHYSALLGFSYAIVLSLVAMVLLLLFAYSYKPDAELKRASAA
jgi:MFS family permease